MNKTFKKMICAAMALCLVATAFSACGKKEGDEEETITRSPNAIITPSAPETTTAPAETTTAPTTAAPTTKAPAKPQPAAPSVQIPQGGGANSADFIASMVQAFGFDYDAKEDVFYTSIDSWQRSGNYIGHYDAIAKFGNMRYKSVKADFSAPDKQGRTLDWRFQFWKGQYGPFGGAEIGVYYKIPGETEELYYCADDDHLMGMEYTIYRNADDYYASRRFFTRSFQEHWWLTGFKAKKEKVNPDEMVMQARIRTYNGTMADAMTQGLLNAGFVSGDALTQMDSFYRSGNDIYILWHYAGFLNY